ncbi:MAG: sn-glycerol-3-phosphate ABC transporter ATP-binding protein UgpC [Candidatus Kaistia colombiensis]|nr:MAG: sn-glycerol-3-phosphate ABC transporter ATP-binding protein UgpC [Kaistia sp.]
MASLAIRGVGKAFGAAAVLRGIDFDIADGEFVALVGPSGCGKSTLLRMIAGLDQVTEGEVLIDGSRVNEKPSKDRDVAMVFQNYALYPHMTVRENMGFALEMRGDPAAERRRRIDEAAEILRLEPLLDRLPRQMSGGQQQRVAMGRAIVRKPKVFLFDEPLSNLDAKLRVAMRAEIRELHRRLKTTTIYVTHDQIEAMTMADRLVVMRGGVVEQIGTPLEVFDRPANTFVATFIGSPEMNLIAGRLETEGGRRLFRSKSGEQLAMGDAANGIPDGPVQLGVRPDHLDIAEDGLAATVDAVEPTGLETMIVTRFEGQPLVAQQHGRVRLVAGDTVRLQPRPSELHFFDFDSGRRIERASSNAVA